MRTFLFLTITVLLLLLNACSFRRVKLHKYKNENASEVKKDNRPILELLNLQSESISAQSGIYSLENGGESLIARLWLFDHAQKSIDIQYYSFAKDVTGLIACHHLLRAADRGVKVRILIDDAAARMNTDEIQLLESHENIEIKVYNAGLRLGQMDKQLKELSKNYKRILRRMHNKTLTVDSICSIIGGRNIADRYFDFSKKYNFRDRDLLLLGKIVPSVSSSFNEFWKSDLSVAYAEIERRLRKKKFKNPKRFDEIHNYAIATKDFSDSMRKQVFTYHDLLKEAIENKIFMFQKNISFVSDPPGKNENQNWKNGPTTDTLKRLIQQAKTSIEIQSPYFITTEETIQLLNEAKARGVTVRLLTNSMGSTDNFEAFSAYKRDRESILKTGVRIYEFKKDAAIRYKLMTDAIQSKINYKAVYGFHPKTIIIDKKLAIVGSYNFDPRSANYNTECVVILRSEELTKNLSSIIEEEFLPANSWPVTMECNPDHKAGLRKRIKVATRIFIPKKLL